MNTPARPLRIGLFVPTFPQASETFIVTKVLKLLELGMDVQIFTYKESASWDAFGALANRDDVRRRVHVLPPAVRSLSDARKFPDALTHSLAHPRSLARYVAHTWRTRHETRQSFLKSLYLRMHFVGYPLDVLHIEFDAQGLGIADLKEFLGCHILYSARGTFQQLSVLDSTPDACEYLFRYVDGYHVISRFLEANTRSLGLDPSVPTWLIEPAIDLTLFRPSRRVPRDLALPVRMISVGRLSWEKGHEFALEAVARVRQAGIPVDYTIYGAGPYREPLLHAIAQLGLGDCARLGGALRREDVPRAFEQADIMVHAALAEGFCNSVIEAQAMELPVVASDAGGLPENVDDRVTGFIVPRRDVDAMAGRLIELARDPMLRQRLGAAGRERALARFDLDRQAEAVARLYRELAARRRRPVRT